MRALPPADEVRETVTFQKRLNASNMLRGLSLGYIRGPRRYSLRSLEVANSPNFLTFLLSFFSLFFQIVGCKI